MENFITFLLDILKISAIFTGIIICLTIILNVIKVPFSNSKNMGFTNEESDYLQDKYIELAEKGLSEEDIAAEMSREIYKLRNKR